MSSDVMRSVSPTGSQRPGIRDERLPPLPTESVRLVDLAPLGAVVKVVVTTSRRPREGLLSGCRTVVDAGATMLQAAPPGAHA